jgi:Mg2+ and Co2+ transporter CorA
MDHKSIISQAAVLSITIVNADGIRRVATPADLLTHVAGGKFFWVDIVGSDEAARASFLGELGFDEADLAWAQRFGQSGRMVIDRRRLRATTWLAERYGKSLIEIHVLASRQCVVTMWNGEAALLDEIREHYAERAAELEKNSSEATAILLQLLLSTLNNLISDLDERIEALRTQLRREPFSIDFSTLGERLQRLQSVWSEFDRYSSAVRMAIVGVEALPDVDQRAAAEWNDYADEVDDVEHRFQERTRWGAEIVQGYAAAVAQRQGDQINRLTIVTLIFLPITFLTGFFGMNFNWMIESVGSRIAFVLLGLLLPMLSAVATVFWLKRRGLM